MALLLPFAIQQAFAARKPGEAARKFQRWAPVALIGVAIPMSVSRSGVIGAVVALLVLIPTWSRQRRRIFLIGLIPGIASLKVAAPGLVHTLLTYFSGLGGNANPYIGQQTRIADYAYVGHYLLEYPFFGLGFGTFMPQVYIFTDNTYLLDAVETGIIGLLVLVGLYLTSLFTAVAARRLTRDPQRRETGQALVASVAVGIAGSATFDALGFPMFSGLYFLILGAVGAYYGIMKTEAGLANGRFEYVDVKRASNS
jgi:O-antigen ligase